MRCKYCNTSIIIPEELRDKKPEDIAETLSEETTGLREVVKLIRANRKIEAIKIYRSQTGLGLREAKEVIDRLAEGRSVQVSSFTVEAQPFYVGADTPFTPKIEDPVKSGRKAGWIGCILSILLGAGILITIGIIMWVAFGSDNPLQSWFGLAPTQTPLPPPPFAESVLSFGGEGTGPGLFTDARYIAVDNAGHVYVGDYDTNRVQVFDTSGNYITYWEVEGRVGELAANRDGIVYVESGSDLYRFNGQTGEVIDQIEYLDFWRFEDVAVMANGNVIAIGDSAGQDRIVGFDPQNNVNLEIENVVSPLTDEEDVAGKVAVDGLGNIYVLGEWHGEVFKFSQDGILLNRFGGEGDEPGQFTSPQDIVVDGQGRVYVGDFGRVIQIFDSDGRYIDTIETDENVDAMVIADNNELYVLQGRNTVVKYILPAP
jgi:outer membrane protein assembly factor BamB